MTSESPDGSATPNILAIISELDEAEALGVTELAGRIGVAKSTAHYHLNALRKERYVVKEDGKYKLGLRFHKIGRRVHRRFPLFDAAKDVIDDLGDQTGELAILMTEQHGLGVHLYKAAGVNAVDIDAVIGDTATLHNRAMGKTILAHLPDQRVKEILDDHGLVAATDETITDRTELHKELARVREDGVAFNRGESLEGIHGVAVPILASDGSILGAVSVAGPAKRLEGPVFTQEYPELLSEARNVIELNLQRANRT